jgi:hypothetical protein
MPDAMPSTRPSPAAREQDRGEQVDVDHCLDVVLRQRLQVAGADVAGVVDQDVQTAHERDGLGDDAVGSRPVGEIGRDHVGRPAAGADLCGGVLQGVAAAADEGERAAGRAEAQRELTPDPAARAGDDDPAVADLHDVSSVAGMR